ncbi:hypothetical protein CLAFUW4_04866 [Fulvia fulva]|uniref:Membrane anchor Opy2 N-terminal domain-containing protein n=1 Tax=Passalora fulva TaxID=5499 RepID=A0A9Q8UU88_PASFU|nr:uncharacterized protein CLAFUR5_12039 [Fulvia fulva]KAK4626286.1 hypothetical protein CLAFUR4_04852 [Fulvia fulva]KAK4628404.1 hypothetical protein CLAFUR0_04856 [Fulvia fulva]UJO22704.1 hypothetical protein CLAFUR5_12039 [Fulvia fulva]WPV14041.1 hypothetical protein CLAFUW4_04866 [Fulvia fulva]WPV29285.1 hypothetical protein CLAFUW7_04860 [Fulvia fulva]
MAHGMHPEVERTMRHIFKRCVQCPANETPTCPDCAKGEICSLIPQDCNNCAHMVCIANPNPAPKSDKTNVGAIAGGVIGGVVFMAVVVFFLWRFWIKKRREQQDLETEEWEEDDIAQQKHTQQFNAMRSDTASTRTKGSIANSILSRASNIIQIAYIPGVTNRNGSGHNSLLANTPVPPIPAAYRDNARGTTTPKSPLSNAGDALFFRPGDLRDSTYSDGSSIRSANNRYTQYTRQSITPSLARSSVMSDIYRDDATAEPMPPMPVQRIMRGAPKMVSVKSQGSSPSESPGSESAPSTVKVMMPGQASSNSSPSSNTGSFVKATPIVVGKNKGRFPIARQNSDSSLTPSAKHAPAVPSPLVETSTESGDEEEHARARRSLIQATARAADPAPLIQPLESPFFDASELQTAASSSAADRPNPYAAMSKTVGHQRAVRNDRGPGGLSAVIEEAAKRASQDRDHDGTGGKRDSSPFSDAHAAK